MPSRVAAVSRRHFLSRSAVGLAAIAFDPISRQWVSSAQANCTAGWSQLPSLDGELILDPAVLTAKGDDFGHIIHSAPSAVLRPGSANDIQKILRFAKNHGLKVATQGRAHSMYGQSQVAEGIVIDASSLSAVLSVDSSGAWVEPGASWNELVSSTLASGLTPPVFTDYTGLSCGGTLNMAGIGGAAHHHGFQVDNVLELEVVTGNGDRHTCSAHHRPLLFEAVLGGLGQYAVITKAKIKLIAAPQLARGYRLAYPSLAALIADLTTVSTDGRFSFAASQIAPNPQGGWLYMMEAASYFNPSSPPNDAALLSGLAGQVIETVEVPYAGWLNRLQPLIEQLKANGAWGIPHPWLDVIVPASATESFVAQALSELTPETASFLIMVPVNRSLVNRPMVQLPAENRSFVVNVTRFTPPVPGLVDAAVGHNRSLYERARAAGGKLYPISAVPMDKDDWRQHYGSLWPRIKLQKLVYDTDRVLTPGIKIFD